MMFRAQVEKGNFDLTDTEVGQWCLDLFLVSLTTLVLATFTDYGWLLFASVPMYTIYAFIIKPFLAWVFEAPSEEDQGPQFSGNRKERRQQERENRKMNK